MEKVGRPRKSTLQIENPKISGQISNNFGSHNNLAEGKKIPARPRNSDQIPKNLVRLVKISSIEIN